MAGREPSGWPGHPRLTCGYSVGVEGVEPPTSCASCMRSNQLSYTPEQRPTLPASPNGLPLFGRPVRSEVGWSSAAGYRLQGVTLRAGKRPDLAARR